MLFLPSHLAMFISINKSQLWASTARNFPSMRSNRYLFLLLLGRFIIDRDGCVRFALLIVFLLSAAGENTRVLCTRRRCAGPFAAFLLLFQALLLLQLEILALDESDECVASPLQLEGCARFQEPIESELRSRSMSEYVGRKGVLFDADYVTVNLHLPNCGAKIFVNVLFVEAKFVQHAHQETILFFGIIFSFVVAIRQAQLMEWGTITGHLQNKDPFNEGERFRLISFAKSSSPSHRAPF